MNDFNDSYFVLHKKDMLRRHRQHMKDFVLAKKYIEKNLEIAQGSLAPEILDIGCADAAFSKLFLELGEVSGVEINHKMAAEAKVILKEVYEKIPKSKTFDVVLIRGTLQHLSDFDEFCEFLRFSLKPGGLFISLANPNSDSLIYRRTGTLPALNVRPGFSSNFQVFSPRTLLNRLGESSYQNVIISYPYLSSAYANPVSDLFFGLYALLTRRNSPRAFPRNMFNLMARKVEN
jgi:SAM-dependent methyltransferase